MLLVENHAILRKGLTVRRAWVVVLASVVLIFGLASPASAGQKGSTSVKAPWGDQAAFSFTWDGRDKFSAGRLSISDNTCDSQQVYARVVVELYSSKVVSLSDKYNRGNCRTTQNVRNIGYQDSGGILRLWIMVCAQRDWPTDDVCAGSHHEPNPYLR